MKLTLLKGNTYINTGNDVDLQVQKVPLPGVRCRIIFDSEDEKKQIIKQLLSNTHSLELFLPYMKEVREVTIND